MRRLLFLAALWATLAPRALASLPITALRGHVATSAGKPIERATVTASSKSLQQPRSTKSTSDGFYWIEPLPPGHYDVTFSAPGHQTVTRRVTVELARIMRLDATLEPSEDEESITATIKTVAVSDTTSITTYRTAEELRTFPGYPSAYHVLYAAPGFGAWRAIRPMLDGVPSGIGAAIGSESIDDVTFTRLGAPLVVSHEADIIDVRTKSGGEELTLTFRDTITNLDWIDYDDSLPPFIDRGGIGHLLETSSGGRILPERLWFFGAGYAGDLRDHFTEDTEGVLVKLTGQVHASHQIVGGYRSDEFSSGPFFTSGDDALWVSHVGQWSSRFTTELIASHGGEEFQFDDVATPLDDDANSLYVRGTYFGGNHVLHGGMQYEKSDIDRDLQRFFVTDRWILSRLTVLAGLAYEDLHQPRFFVPVDEAFDRDGFEQQLAATYDLRGDGRHALIGTATRRNDDAREFTLGYASSIGSGGMWRVDAVRRDLEAYAVESIQADASYRLFGRLGAGGNYAWTRTTDDGVVPSLPQHTANAWFNVEVPFFDTHALSATVVQRYNNYDDDAGIDDVYATDAALRYTFPVRRLAVTLAGDVENVFNAARRSLAQPRTYRFWIRLGL